MSKNKMEKGGKPLSFEDAEDWLFSRGQFHSSVRILSKEWHWGTTKVSTFLKRLEDQKILKRTLRGGGLTHFEMLFQVDEFPVFLKSKKQGKSKIGIDIEQVYLGNLILSEDSLQQLKHEYERIMLKDGLTDLSAAEIDMMGSILEKQMPQRTEIFVRADAPENPKRSRLFENIRSVSEKFESDAKRFVNALQDDLSRQIRGGRS